jgi:hypothetical protein
MIYLKSYSIFESVSFEKVINYNRTLFKPSFGGKVGETDFYQIVYNDKPVAEIEVKRSSINGKPEILSIFSEKKGSGRILVNKILEMYLEDELFVLTTRKSKPFWIKMGATEVDGDLYHFTR